MAKISIWDIKEELVVFLRNADIISISDRGVTTSQDTGTFTGDTSHTLATNPTLAKNIRNINVDGTDLKYVKDYTVNYSTGVITFLSPQTGSYIIDYDQGSTDRVFPDFPQPYLTLKDFPRIAVDIISGETTEFELGAGGNWTDYQVTIVAYNKNQKEVDQMIAAIRAAIQDNKKNFGHCIFITPTLTGPIIVAPFGKNKIFQRNQDAEIRFVYED